MNREKEILDPIDELLQGIDKVEAPMFLYTKIQARLKGHLEESIAAKYVWSVVLSFAILLMLNLWTIQEATFQAKDSVAVMVEQMDLMPNNDSFY